MTTTSNDRAAYITGLRQLADVLEQHPEIPLPFQGRATEMMLFFHDEDQREQMAAAARALPAEKWDKGASEGDHPSFTLTGKLAGLRVQLYADRAAVCERVVTGTRTVTTTVKDPEALAAVPEVEVTEEVEDVEWRCHPVLAPAVSP